MTYQYTTLPDSNIRLLRLLPGRSGDQLRGEIFEVAFFSHHSGHESHTNSGAHDPPKPPSYEALSYVWGSEENPEPIFFAADMTMADSCDVTSLNLVPNLHSALSHLRREDTTRVLWCDRICIDQSNDAERAREVARMAKIYQTAEKVIIWLGPKTEDSHLAINALHHAGSQVEIDPKTRTWRPIPNADPRFSWEAQDTGPPFSEPEMSAIKALMALPWFKRLWTRQEVTLARTAVIIAGYDKMPWKTFIAAAMFMDSLVRLRDNGDTVFGRDLFNIYELGCLKEYHGLMEVLHACRACQCTKEIDRVYGMLGLLAVTHRPITLTPDYTKQAKRAYQDLVLEAYHCERRLDMLALCEAAREPSWVPDLDNLDLNTGLHTRVVPYCRASGEAEASLVPFGRDVIEVYGVKCAVLGRQVSPPNLKKTADAKELKQAIVNILREFLGQDVSKWDQRRLESTAKGLLGTIWHERTGRQNHSSLAFAMAELQKWASETSSGGLTSDDYLAKGPSRVLFNHIVRVLFHGDTCRLTQDGGIGLGFHGCREGDFLYAILGCRRLMVLRPTPEGGKYRIIGKFDHPRYNDGEALLGDLGAGWKTNYKHLLSASNRPKFEHEDGTSQWKDPRLQLVDLPIGWREEQDQDGIPYWLETGGVGKRMDFDPRLTPHALRERGVEVERLVLV